MFVNLYAQPLFATGGTQVTSDTARCRVMIAVQTNGLPLPSRRKGAPQVTELTFGSSTFDTSVRSSVRSVPRGICATEANRGNGRQPTDGADDGRRSKPTTDGAANRRRTAQQRTADDERRTKDDGQTTDDAATDGTATDGGRSDNRRMYDEQSYTSVHDVYVYVHITVCWRSASGELTTVNELHPIAPKRTNERTNEQTNERTKSEKRKGTTNERTNERTNEKRKGTTNERTNEKRKRTTKSEKRKGTTNERRTNDNTCFAFVRSFVCSFVRLFVRHRLRLCSFGFTHCHSQSLTHCHSLTVTHSLTHSLSVVWPQNSNE